MLRDAFVFLVYVRTGTQFFNWMETDYSLVDSECRQDYVCLELCFVVLLSHRTFLHYLWV